MASAKLSSGPYALRPSGLGPLRPRAFAPRRALGIFEAQVQLGCGFVLLKNRFLYPFFEEKGGRRFMRRPSNDRSLGNGQTTRVMNVGYAEQWY